MGYVRRDETGKIVIWAALESPDVSEPVDDNSPEIVELLKRAGTPPPPPPPAQKR